MGIEYGAGEPGESMETVILPSGLVSLVTSLLALVPAKLASLVSLASHSTITKRFSSLHRVRISNTVHRSISRPSCLCRAEHHLAQCPLQLQSLTSINMIRTYREIASCAPSRQKDVYIFSVTPVADRALAAITSADELLLLQDRGNLKASSISLLQDVPKGLTSLASSDEGKTTICAGSDGHVVTFDMRTRLKATHFTIGTSYPPVRSHVRGTNASLSRQSGQRSSVQGT